MSHSSDQLGGLLWARSYIPRPSFHIPHSPLLGVTRLTLGTLCPHRTGTCRAAPSVRPSLQRRGCARRLRAGRGDRGHRPPPPSRRPRAATAGAGKLRGSSAGQEGRPGPLLPTAGLESPAMPAPRRELLTGNPPRPPRSRCLRGGRESGRYSQLQHPLALQHQAPVGAAQHSHAAPRLAGAVEGRRKAGGGAQQRYEEQRAEEPPPLAPAARRHVRPARPQEVGARAAAAGAVPAPGRGGSSHRGPAHGRSRCPPAPHGGSGRAQAPNGPKDQIRVQRGLWAPAPATACSALGQVF